MGRRAWLETGRQMEGRGVGLGGGEGVRGGRGVFVEEVKNKKNKKSSTAMFHARADLRVHTFHVKSHTSLSRRKSNNTLKNKLKNHHFCVQSTTASFALCSQ